MSPFFRKQGPGQAGPGRGRGRGREDACKARDRPGSTLFSDVDAADDGAGPGSGRGQRSGGPGAARDGAVRCCARRSCRRRRSSRSRCSTGSPTWRPTGRRSAAELDQVLSYRDALPNFQDISVDQASITDDDGWKTYFFSGYGFRSEANCARCPQTAALLDGVPGTDHGVLLDPRPAQAHRRAPRALARGAALPPGVAGSRAAPTGRVSRSAGRSPTGRRGAACSSMTATSITPGMTPTACGSSSSPT